MKPIETLLNFLFSNKWKNIILLNKTYFTRRHNERIRKFAGTVTALNCEVASQEQY